MTPDTYTVRVTRPSGSTPTYDSDGTGTADRSTLTLTASENNTQQDFGYRWTGSIGNRIWEDRDADGVQDSNEPGISGRNVELRFTGCSAGSTCPTTTTDTNGTYTFSNLAPRSYTVVVTSPPSGASRTYDADGTGSANQSTLTLGTNATNNNQDFGYRWFGSIGNQVWEDRDADGVLDAGEPRLASVLMELRYTGCSAFSTCPTTTTNSLGQYSFSNLGPRTYTVVVRSPPGGASRTYDADGTGSPNQSTLTLGTNASNQFQDFGYRWFGSVGDRVWDDVDGDGVQDSGEGGWASVPIEIRYSGCTPGSTCPTTTTNGSGNYIFSNLGPRTYTVVVTTPPANASQTYDSDGTGTPHQSTFYLGSNSNNLTQDFGYQGALTTIMGLVWEDMNDNGVRDAGEPGLDGVFLEAQSSKCTAGVDCPTTTTNFGGIYTLQQVPAGVNTVVVTQPTGSTPTYDPDGISTPNTSTLTVQANQPVDGHYFGYKWSGSVGGHVWNDLDIDGVLDPGEPGRSEFLFELAMTAVRSRSTAHSSTPRSTATSSSPTSDRAPTT